MTGTAYVVERKRNDGTTRFLACYRDPEGRIRSAGTHPTRRAAERAAHREEQEVLAGSWRDATLGAVTVRNYVEGDWLPSKHIEPTTRAAYVSNLDKHFYPFFGRRLMYQITGLPGPRLGDPGRRRPLTPLHPQVPHHAALDLLPRGPRPAHRDQPVRAHRAAQDHRPEVPHADPHRVNPADRRNPRPVPAAVRDRHRDRHAVG
ncbi:MAG: hypothetical protein QOK15_1939 [Nocardioidaceae bacterium]|nr:hypothetical protein [Nocardioidaceae bacterium]